MSCAVVDIVSTRLLLECLSLFLGSAAYLLPYLELALDLLLVIVFI